MPGSAGERKGARLIAFTEIFGTFKPGVPSNLASTHAVASAAGVDTMADNINPGWRGNLGKPRNSHGWQTGARDRGKWFREHRKKLFLFLGLLVCVGVGIWLTIFLRRPEQGLVLLVTVDPSSNAARLDTPWDPLGWASVPVLQDALTNDPVGGERRVKSDVLPAPAVGKLEVLAKQLMQASTGVKQGRPVLVYFGMLGAADEKGAFLFGDQGNRLYVLELLEKLKESNKAIPLVLIFDAARLPCFPEQGIVQNTFVKSLDEQLKQSKFHDSCPHIAIVCSSSPNETAWNDDYKGCTVYAAQLINALRGGACRDHPDAGYQYDYPVKDVLAYAKKKTTEWTSERNISPQTPVIICGEDLVVNRDNLFLKRDHNNEVGFEKIWENLPEPSARADSREMDKPWKTLEQLAANKPGRPGPHVYSPIRWQQYRQLLCRYEIAQYLLPVLKTEPYGKAARDVRTKLLDRLQELATEIEKTCTPHPLSNITDIAKTSLVWDDLLGTASNRPVLTRLPPPEQAREVESNLAAQFDNFWRGRVKKEDALPDAVSKLAVDTRELAERAALACPKGAGDAFPYPERFWAGSPNGSSGKNVLSSRLAPLDHQRRVAEDYLFTNEIGKGESRLKDLNTQYGAVVTAERHYQEALAIYQAALSDLTPLADWQFYCAETLPDSPGKADFLTLALKLREGMGILAGELDLSVDKSGAALARAKDIQALLFKQRQAFHAYLKSDLSASSHSRGNLHRYHSALLFPWPGEPGADQGARVASQSTISRARIWKEYSSLLKNTREGDAAKTETSRVPNRDAMALQRTAILRALVSTAPGCQPNPKATTAAIATQWQATSDKTRVDLKTAETPGGEGRLLAAERDSRTAWLTDIEKGRPEPAAELRRVQWANLLLGQGNRFANDHWFNDKSVYSAKLAGYYRDAAAQLRKIDLPPPPQPPQLQIAVLDGKNANWTSEQWRDFEFAVTCTSPPSESAVASVFVGEHHQGKAFLKIAQRSPVGIPLKQEQVKGSFALELADQPTATQGASTCRVEPVLFFRGQFRSTDLAINDSRRPEMTVTTGSSTSRASLTVSADEQLGVGGGRLAIVMDYSGSMKLKIQGTDITRHEAAISSLRKLFDELPSGVFLSLRVFSDEQSSKSTYDRVLKKYPDLDVKDEMNYKKFIAELSEEIDSWVVCSGRLGPKKRDGKRQLTEALLRSSPDDPTPTRGNIKVSEVIAVLQDKLTPYNATPLIRSMIKGYETDIRGKIEDEEKSTLLVLTDGADTSLGPVEEKLESDAEREEKQKRILAAFQKAKCRVRVILFNDETGAEVENARAELACLKKLSPSPGEVYRARDEKSLLAGLRASLAPELQVIDKQSNVPVLNGATNTFPLPTNPGLMPTVSKLQDRDYELKLWGGSDEGSRLVHLYPGQHMYFRATRDASDRVTFIQEPFAPKWKEDSVSANAEPGCYCKQGGWFLTIPAKYALDNIYRSIVTIEKAPVADASGSRLMLRRPRVSWDVKVIDAAGKTVPATVHLVTADHYFAWAWNLAVRPDELPPNAQVQVTAYPLEDRAPGVPSRAGKEGTSLRGVSGTELQNKNRLKFNGQHGVITVAREGYRLSDQGKPEGKESDCLIVRIQNTGGKRLEVDIPRLRELHLDKRVDHVYYDQANALTVIFSGFDWKQLEGEALDIQVTDAGVQKQAELRTTVSFFGKLDGPRPPE